MPKPLIKTSVVGRLMKTANMTTCFKIARLQNKCVNTRCSYNPGGCKIFKGETARPF